MWKDINDLLPDVPPGRYEVSSKGEVKSLAKTITDVLGRTRRIPEKMMSCPKNLKGYPAVSFQYGSCVVTREVHRLVALAFVPNPLGLTHVNHIDGIKFHNDSANLEWTTQADNNVHAWKTGLRDCCKGAKHHRATVSDEVLLKAKKMIEEGMTQKQVAEVVGVNRATISKWMSGKWRTS